MAQTLMAQLPGLARTITMVPTGHLYIIHPGWLELLLAKIIFYDSKPVRAIDVLLHVRC